MKNSPQIQRRIRTDSLFKNHSAQKQIRQRICDEAARIMIEEGINDFQHAKRKASSRLSIRENFLLPSNREIDLSLQERLRIFTRKATLLNLDQYRQAAIEIMEFLSSFRPRIVGTILENYVTPSASINLHLFAQTPEEVMLFLTDHQISFRSADKRFRLDKDRIEYIPVLQLNFEDIPIDGAIFPPKGLRQAPLSPVDGNPMKRANVEQLRSRNIFTEQ